MFKLNCNLHNMDNDMCIQSIGRFRQPCKEERGYECVCVCGCVCAYLSVILSECETDRGSEI